MMAPPQVISNQLLRKNPTLIPYPALSEKTLVLAEFAVVGTADTPDRQLSLMVRCGPVPCLLMKIVFSPLHHVDAEPSAFCGEKSDECLSERSPASVHRDAMRRAVEWNANYEEHRRNVKDG